MDHLFVIFGAKFLFTHVISALKSIAQMIFHQGKSTENNLEQGRSRARISNILSAQEAPLPHIDDTGRPKFLPDDQLNLFRHLTGISSHPSMTHTYFRDESGGRPAPNVGIYARVVHNELTSKIGFKYFSWLINGCLGLQIIVAAALTAMGAAGASRSAVTAFGAINTVIAGILTFFKGSGLPNRLKYYQTEWKRVREFIEQRERDFGRPGCDLDLYGVVAMAERMYEDVKVDLEASTPDRFAGFSSARKTQQSQQQGSSPTQPILPPLPRSTAEPLSEKLLESGIGGRVKNLALDIGHKFNSAQATVEDLQDLEENVTEDANRGVKEWGDRVERLKTSFDEQIKHQTQLPQEVAQDLQACQREGTEGFGRDERVYAKRFERTASGKFKGPIMTDVPGTSASPNLGRIPLPNSRDGYH